MFTRILVAIKYNDTGRNALKVAAELARIHGSELVALHVIDYRLLAEGVPAAEREQVFERFYRADKARTRRVDGVGLGLSLSREIIRAHHGELMLDESRDGWTRFSVLLPALPPPATRNYT